MSTGKNFVRLAGGVRNIRIEQMDSGKLTRSNWFLIQTVVANRKDSEGPVLDFRQLSAIISRVCGTLLVHPFDIDIVRSF